MILAQSMVPGRGVGLWAGIIYATMPIPYIAASYITPDTPLALMTTLAMLCFWQSVRPQATRVGLWKVLMSAALGLGFLCKGPAALIPTAGMFAYLLVHGRVRDYFFHSVSLACLAVFLVVGLWWYVWVSIQVPGAARYFFDNQIWGRLVSDKYERNPGFGGALIYLPTILLGCLPWSVGWFTQRKFWLGEKLSRDLWRRFRADPAGSLSGLLDCGALCSSWFWPVPNFRFIPCRCFPRWPSGQRSCGFVKIPTRGKFGPIVFDARS